MNKLTALEKAERINEAMIAAAPTAAEWQQKNKPRRVVDDEIVRAMIRERLERRAGLAA